MSKPSPLLLFVALALPFSMQASAIWGLKSLAVSGGSSAPTHLFVFDDTGGLITDLGAVKIGTANIDGDGLAIYRRNLFAFALAGGNSQLISVDPATAQATTIGSALAGRDIRGAAFDVFGTLWALDVVASQLLTIGPLTGLELTATNLSSAITTVSEMAFAGDGTAWLVDSAPKTKIYILNTANGVMSLQYTDNTVGGQGENVAAAGLAFGRTAPTVAHTYEITGTDDIYAYDTGAGFARTMPYANILSSYNSGRGDLASDPVPEPASLLLTGLGFAGIIWARRPLSR